MAAGQVQVPLSVCVCEHVCVCVHVHMGCDKVREVMTGNVVQEPKTRVTKDFTALKG